MMAVWRQCGWLIGLVVCAILVMGWSDRAVSVGTRAAAGDLTFGTPATGTLRTGETLSYRLVLTADSPVEIRYKPGISGVLPLELHAGTPDGDLIASVNNDISEKVLFVPTLPAGEYHVVIAHTLTWAMNANYWLVANSALTTVPITEPAALPKAGVANVYAIPVETAGPLYVTVEKPQATGTLAQLFGATVANNPITFEKSNYSHLLIANSVEPGMYYLMLTTTDGAKTERPCTIRVTRGAIPLPLDTPVDGQLDRPGQILLYRTEATMGTPLYVSLCKNTAWAGFVEVRQGTPDGQVVATVERTTETPAVSLDQWIEIPKTVTGPYFVRVEPFNRTAPIPAAQPFVITARQNLQVLSETPTAVSLPGTHSIRWYRMPAAGGQPLYALADHNSENALTLTMTKGTLSGTVAATIAGGKDQLLYLPQPTNDQYLLKISDSTVPNCTLTAGNHLPTVTKSTPVTGSIASAADIQWYEVPVSAGEEVVLHLDKDTNYAHATPLLASPTTPPTTTGTANGDAVEFLLPTENTTYFVRVAGSPGSYVLRAARTHQALPLGSATDAAMAHEGDERWFEVTAPAGKPLFLVAEKTQGTDTPVDVYTKTLTATPVTFGGPTSAYYYFPAQSTATRYIIRKRAPLSGFTPDVTETLYAGTTLTEIAAGQTRTGRIQSVYHRKYYQITMPAGKPLTLQNTLPITIEEPATRKTLAIGTKAAVAGLGSPAVLVVSAETATNYTLTGSLDMSQAGKLYFSNASLEACVDLAKTTVSRVKFLAGTNTFLSGENDTTHVLSALEGAEFASGWQLQEVTASPSGMQLTWQHPVKQVTKDLLLRATAQRGELTSQIDTPRPLVVRNAFQLPATAESVHTFALPIGGVVSNTYTPATTALVHPTIEGTMSTLTERWAAVWNSTADEVYGFTLGPDYQIALSTEGGYTIARMRVPAGRTSYTMHLARPKPEPPYQAIKAMATRPALSLTHTADARLVPLGSPITGTIMAQNVGTGTATGLTVTCTLPDNVSYVSNSASQNGTYAGATRTVTWTIDTLAAGETKPLTYGYTIAATTALESTIELNAALRSAELTEPVRASARVVTTAPALSGVTPTNPGNTGPVTLTLQGTCLSPNADMTLTQGERTLTATTSGGNNERTEVRALVDISGLTGVWTVTVTNPGGSTATLSNAITLSEGGKSAFWCELSGPPLLKLNTWQTLTVQYTNQGSVDEVGRLLALYVPVDSYTVGTVRDDQGRVLASADLAQSLSGPLLVWLPRVGPGESHTLSVQIKPSAVRGRAVGALYPNISLLTCPLTRTQVTLLAQQAAFETLDVIQTDRTPLNALVSPAVNTALGQWAASPARPLWAAMQEIITQVQADANLRDYLTGADADIVGRLLERAVGVLKTGGISNASLVVKRQYMPSVTASGPTHTKIGPMGISSLGYVTPGETFEYTIIGRNPATAVGANRDVRITDKLDGSLDWTTLQMVALRIGTKTLSLRGVTFPYTGYLDLRPAVNAIAEVRITFDGVSGQLTWELTGYHPVTWEKTDFLPQNTDTNAPLGEVEVRFDVHAKSTLASGIQIKNRAAVSLDGAVGTYTNEVVNTIDSAPPSSAVSRLPEVQEDPKVRVQWSGQDENLGAGLVNYSIFVSDNGGPYTLWKEKVTTTAADFTGVLGHTYTFYSIAEDAVGHVEDAPSTADASIKIGRDLVMARGLRLISIPLKPTEADPKALLGFTESKWASYLPGTGYVTYGNDPNHVTWLSPAERVPGRAFWGYWKANKLVDPQGEVVPLTAPYSLPLQTGWNLFGNPWNTTISWDLTAITVIADNQTKTLAQAAQSGWIAEYAWGWVPSTANPDTGQYWMIADSSITAAKHSLEGWQGYWIKTTRPCTLVLPAPGTTTATATRISTRRLLPAGWQVQLIARTATGEDGFNWLGTGSAQVVNTTRAMLTPPPALDPAVELAFDGDRAIDLRQDGQPLTPWRFTVSAASPGEPVTLSWPDLTSVPAGVGLVLVDELTGTRHYLRTLTDYTFTMPADGRTPTFRIESETRGTLRFLSVQSSTLARSGAQPIRYMLSQDATTRAEVRTMNGKLIRTLAGGYTAGRTPATLAWDGRSAGGSALPRGTYLITLTATGTDGRIVRATTTCRMQ